MAGVENVERWVAFDFVDRFVRRCFPFEGLVPIFHYFAFYVIVNAPAAEICVSAFVLNETWICAFQRTQDSHPIVNWRHENLMRLLLG